MPGNIGPLEIIIVLIIALVVFGPKRLPELGSSLGRGIREFKHRHRRQARRRARRRRKSAQRLERNGGSGRATGQIRGRFRQTRLRRTGMPRRVKAVSHEDQLSLVEHLDELRNRHCRLLRRPRRRPGALLLAEPPAAGNRRRPAALRPQAADHLRHHRALHDDGDGGRLRRDRAGAAVPALPALRLRAARLQPLGAEDDPADPAALPAALPRRARLLLLRGDAGGRQASCSTSTTASSTSRSGPATTTASSR